MDLHQLEWLIPDHGKEVWFIAHHPTLGRGRITLLSPGHNVDDDEADDEDCCSEGLATFLPDASSQSQLLGLIAPRGCACGRCNPFELVNHDGDRRGIREKIEPFHISRIGWAPA